ncbi:ferritin-like domain-containing protein [Planotetraspora sp. A-T 1434]|uniref:ferritin-like domain-containing protein n=1 Tax=Planotetraspora sp. A-T 1434 TaxID=2979219 RepID=UPI0021C117E8|nr:ferritin-like domain-containing protein [Planotetraspora sp. A-T 1434]MCT9932574.1 ferritin-like domain-containing protein [Planotetraspora sp. A-T 1434]
MTDSSPGIVDLLGVLAYAELTAFLRLAEDAALLAPTLNDRAALGDVAATEYGHFRVLRDRLESLGVDAEEAMAPFVDAIDAWHAQTKPRDWHEALVKAYVGTGIAGDFYREAARRADPSTRELVDEVLADTGRSEFAVERVRAAIEADPRLSGRLALWARRMVGEALSQGQRLAAARPELAGLLVGEEGEDLAEVGRLFARLTEEHGKRMAALGLTPGA